MANTELMPNLVAEYADKLYKGLYGEQDETLLACMAAGVSASEMYLTAPKVIWEGNKCTLKSNIGFKREWSIN